MAALGLLEQDGLAENARNMGALFKKLLIHPAILEVRGKGLMLAVELGSGDLVQHVVMDSLQQGILGFWFLSCPSAFRIAPPLVITAEDVQRACTVILSALDATYTV